MEGRWPEMADAARQVWNDWFSDEVLFDRFGDALAAILERRVIPEFAAQRIPNILEWDWRLRRGVHHLSSRFPWNRRATHRNVMAGGDKIATSHEAQAE
jgi:hypothetical protein